MACGAPAARYYEGAGRPSSLNYGVGHNHWFLFVIVTSFILTFLWSLFYFLQLKESINMKLPFSWLKLVSFQIKKPQEIKFQCFRFYNFNYPCIVVNRTVYLLAFSQYCAYLLSTRHFPLQELYYTFVVTLLYILAWIVLLAGFGWCAGREICDARIAAGVS